MNIDDYTVVTRASVESSALELESMSRRYLKVCRALEPMFIRVGLLQPGGSTEYIYLTAAHGNIGGVDTIVIAD